MMCPIMNCERRGEGEGTCRRVEEGEKCRYRLRRVEGGWRMVNGKDQSGKISRGALRGGIAKWKAVRI